MDTDLVKHTLTRAVRHCLHDPDRVLYVHADSLAALGYSLPAQVADDLARVKTMANSEFADYELARRGIDPRIAPTPKDKEDRLRRFVLCPITCEQIQKLTGAKPKAAASS